MKKTLFAVISVLMVVSMLFVACSDKEDVDDADNSTTVAPLESVKAETNGDFDTTDAVEPEKNTEAKATEVEDDSDISEQATSEKLTTTVTESPKETDKVTETEKTTEAEKTTETETKAETGDSDDGDWNLGEADPI